MACASSSIATVRPSRAPALIEALGRPTMRSRLLVQGFVVAVCITACAYRGPCQSPATVTTGQIGVRVTHAIHEQEESTVSYVTIAVTIRSTEQPFVVPNCSTSSDEKTFCLAWLRRANGKPIGVRKGLSASLGVEDASTWRPVRLPPNSNNEFEFSIDMGLLRVRPGQPLILAFGIWPDEESMTDPKKMITVITPMFRIPEKPE